MNTTSVTFRPAGITALERASMPTVCQCCGREELKRTVKMIGSDGSVNWWGTGCAAKATGIPARDITKAAKAEQDATDAAEWRAREERDRAESARWFAHLDARCPELRGQVFRQIQALGGMSKAREGYAG